MATISPNPRDWRTHQTIPWIKTDNINKSSLINIPGLKMSFENKNKDIIHKKRSHVCDEGYTDEKTKRWDHVSVLAELADGHLHQKVLTKVKEWVSLPEWCPALSNSSKSIVKAWRVGCNSQRKSTNLIMLALAQESTIMTLYRKVSTNPWKRIDCVPFLVASVQCVLLLEVFASH